MVQLVKLREASVDDELVAVQQRQQGLVASVGALLGALLGVVLGGRGAI